MHAIGRMVLPVLLAATLCVSAGESPQVTGKVEGKIYTDWSIKLKEGADPKHGFGNHRAYFGYKMTVAEKFVGRVMLDVGRVEPVTAVDTVVVDGAAAEASTSHDLRLEAYAKYAYLQIKKLIPMTTLTLGLQGRYQFKYQEKFWGYRYLYKSFMDKYKYGSSADLGLGIKVAPMDKLTLHINVENGEGYKEPQMDQSYKVSGGIRIVPLELLELYVYGDGMPAEDEETQFTAAGFVGLRPLDILKFGVEYDFQGNHKGTKDASLHGVSAYTSVSVVKPVEIFARVDVLSRDEWESAEKVIIGGVAYSPIKNLALAPNVQVTMPADEGAEPITRILVSGQFKF